MIISIFDKETTISFNNIRKFAIDINLDMLVDIVGLGLLSHPFFFLLRNASLSLILCRLCTSSLSEVLYGFFAESAIKHCMKQ